MATIRRAGWGVAVAAVLLSAAAVRAARTAGRSESPRGTALRAPRPICDPKEAATTEIQEPVAPEAAREHPAEPRRTREQLEAAERVRPAPEVEADPERFREWLLRLPAEEMAKLSFTPTLDRYVGRVLQDLTSRDSADRAESEIGEFLRRLNERLRLR